MHNDINSFVYCGVDYRHTIIVFNRDYSYHWAHLGILKSALMGFSPKRGGVLSATSMAVMPNDHTSALAS